MIMIIDIHFLIAADPTGPGPCTRLLTGLSALLVRFSSFKDFLSSILLKGCDHSAMVSRFLYQGKYLLFSNYSLIVSHQIQQQPL